MAARDKSAMKVSLSRSRFPTFLFIILLFIVVVLLYYYWSLSSSNQVLLRELKILESGKLETERKRSALESQIFEIENERRLAEEDLEKERSRRVENEKTAMEVSSELHGQLQITTEQLYTAEENEKQYQAELEKLKKGVNSSSLDLQKLKGRADELLKKYKETKESHSSLLQKVAELTSERDVCQKELVKVQMELDQQKKTQDVKVVPSDKNVLDKADDEKKATDEGSDKDTKESEKGDDKKDDKESEKDDENNDENAETPKEEKEKESVEVKSPMPSRASANQKNASVSPNVTGNIKPDGKESQIKETDKRNQGNPDTSEEVEKETGKDEGNTEQPNEEESPEEDKDMDSQPVTAKDKKITKVENKDEVNEEDEEEEEESDDDSYKTGRMERSMSLAADMRRRMQPLHEDSPETMTRNAQPAGNMEEIRKLKKSPMDPQGLMPGRINMLDIPKNSEEMRRGKKADDQDQ
ncbi:DNA ligase 1-like isoform X1 [Orbicella faveolata]|uniref:DNA ligase 1-like isoform X1 n=1 Tax=Orbicella faveolata TaxID=48498 RepID=UPI0009E555B0|nr:DNA ligase 1-like isoform X1 [Orbicella faveolata]XP_020626765.1 DNA ligase 1-like isoform X1 [Orbicella faveolata]